MRAIHYLTQLLGQRVHDAAGSLVGTITDVIAVPGQPLPRLFAVCLRRGADERLIAWERIQGGPGRFVLTAAADGDLVDSLPDDALWLRRDVLDKQIVDTHDFRVVRVNDVRLAPCGGYLCVLGVDPGESAVLRRLLPGNWGEHIVRLLHLPPAGKIIAWNDVEPTTHSENGVLRLRTARDKLAELHPADIADIIEQMNPSDRAAVLEGLDVETAADVVTEAEDAVQVEIMQHLDAEVAADILEEMEPDDAADVVGDLPGSRRKELLDEMETEEADEVRELLTYDEDTAGGLMTTEYVALPLDLTAEEAIVRLREMAPEAETIYYIYVVEPFEGEKPGERLVGVISLRDLIVAAPHAPLWNFMVENVIRVGLDARIEEVASALERYDLLAVPVVDEEDRLQGIVTVDDALEELLTDSWRRKRFRTRHSRGDES